MKLTNVKNKIEKVKEINKAKEEANRIAICKTLEKHEIIEVTSIGKKYKVYDLTITVGKDDVTDFMPGNKYGDMTHVSKKIEEARRFWKKHEKNIRFEEIK